ncbi:unnamed protein product [Musa acuminata subsp. malaccensis]|uniref:(wild Malaysian banana) hypothetical protein n=1 Tax=Musa acuminata subsp. malaccensis TaxID=214687 RepID=A0A804IRJ0_MUSAM|nr:unnamed protein product [Musa acuminata subsp. malaccensis]
MPCEISRLYLQFSSCDEPRSVVKSSMMRSDAGRRVRESRERRRRLFEGWHVQGQPSVHVQTSFPPFESHVLPTVLIM